MKAIPDISSKTHIIWLIFFALLLSPGLRGDGINTANPLRNLRQTELTLTAQDKRSKKTSCFAHSGFTSKQTFSYSRDLLLSARIIRHSQVAVLKWQVSGKHVLSPSLNFFHAKTSQNDDEDLSLLKG